MGYFLSQNATGNTSSMNKAKLNKCHFTNQIEAPKLCNCPNYLFCKSKQTDCILSEVDYKCSGIEMGCHLFI